MEIKLINYRDLNGRGNGTQVTIQVALAAENWREWYWLDSSPVAVDVGQSMPRVGGIRSAERRCRQVVVVDLQVGDLVKTFTSQFRGYAKDGKAGVDIALLAGEEGGEPEWVSLPNGENAYRPAAREWLAARAPAASPAIPTPEAPVSAPEPTAPAAGEAAGTAETAAPVEVVDAPASAVGSDPADRAQVMASAEAEYAAALAVFSAAKQRLVDAEAAVSAVSGVSADASAGGAHRRPPVTARVRFEVALDGDAVRVLVAGRPETEERIPVEDARRGITEAAYGYVNRHVGPREVVGNKGGSLANKLREVLRAE